jgi:hypothetical protein
MVFSGTKNEHIVQKILCHDVKITGDTVVSGTISITGASTLNTLEVSGSSTLDTITVNNLIVNNSLSYNNTVGTPSMAITEKNDDVDYNLVFSTGSGTNRLLHVDSVTTPCTINPNTGSFNIVDTVKITDFSIAVGKSSGSIDQHSDSIALGNNSGSNNQKNESISIGHFAGNFNQKNNSIAIGSSAGQTNQGVNSISIGTGAGKQDQSDNSIILNSTGLQFDAVTTGLFVKPIRSEIGVSNYESLYYNTSTGEIFSTPLATSYGDVDITGYTNVGGLTTLNGGATISGGDLNMNGNSTFLGAIKGNTTLIISDPLVGNVQHLSENDSGRLIMVNNSSNVTTIQLPDTLSINTTLTLLIMFNNISQEVNINITPGDNKIVGTVINNGSQLQIDGNTIKCSSSLPTGSSITLTNYPRNGGDPAWFISAGGISSTASGYIN